jgi:4-amino-4-deoxy-L-arabinose transferase-like glycosyltransferase
MIARLPTVALVVLLLAGAALFTWIGWSVILFPYPVDYGEGPLLDQAVRLSQGQNIYDADFSAAPYTVSNYPPLYPAFQALGVLLFGPAFWYGRLLSWLATLAAAGTVAALVWTLTRSRLAATIGGGSFLAMPFVVLWAPLFRVDCLALAASLGGLLLVVRGPERRSWLLAAAVLMTLAVFTRQSYALAAPATACIWLLGISRRRAIELASTVGCLCLASYAALSLGTGGGFHFHIVSANVNEYRPDRLLFFGRELVALLPAFVLAGLAYVATARTDSPRAWRLVAAYLTAASVAALTIGKAGSNVNYLIEVCAGLALAAGLLHHRLRAQPVWQPLFAVVLLLQLSVLIGGTRYQEHLRSKLAQGPRLAALAQVVDASDGPVLADEELGLLPLASRNIELQPFEMAELARSGRWDATPLLDSLEQGRFETILMHGGPGSPVHRTRWTPAMLASIEKAYRPVASYGPTVVYRFRGAGE